MARKRIGPSTFLPRGFELCEPQLADAVALAFGRLRVSEHHPIDRFRRLDGDVAVVDVGGDLRRVALERIAEAARRGPQHGVDVGGVLHEVLLPELERFGFAFQLVDVVDQLGRLYFFKNI